MNILCYMNNLYKGGAERVMSVLASGLSQLGHTVTVVTDYCDDADFPLGEAVHRVVLEGQYVDHEGKGRLRRNLRRILQLRRLCRERETDVVVSFMEDAYSRALLATRGLDTKCLISIRTDPKELLQSKKRWLQMHLLAPLAEGCVFQTEQARRCLPKRLQRKSRIIVNPVSERFYETSPGAMQEKRVVACGRLEQQKRFDLLMDAFCKVCDDFPEYILEIYGTGWLEEDLQQQIDDLERADRIRLMGRQENIPDAIKAASLFVLSSDYEGLPNALMEAMALGLPVVSTDCSGGGARTLIENGRDGLIVPCDDADALAAAIRESLSDPAAAKARGDRAKEKAQTFRTAAVAAQWEAYLKEIVEGK